ncbi:shikimate dehydrogenase [Streptomyces purpureus]|uniref:shikimate dehydrogenase n=1 Tax=Streptomyces purpureus TaxID=1951 RepID=UPI0037AC0FAF
MRAAVLGSPVSHSLSPVLHTAAYEALGLADWTYTAIDCEERELPAFLGGLDDTWAGVSLTMPLKRAVLPLLDTVSPRAAAVGAVNTVVRRDGRLHGENTDVHGIRAALAEAGVTTASTAVVLGGGATACSALAALAELGARRPTVLVRDPARTTALRATADRLGVTPTVAPLTQAAHHLPGAPLVLTTLPPGAADDHAPLLGPGVLFDVVYTPWPTRAAHAAAAAGARVASGLSMLLHQAVGQVALMTGHPDVPVPAMRTALTRAANTAAAFPSRPYREPDVLRLDEPAAKASLE